MPTASEEQVPKPLTYTLMYHGLWCAMFVMTAAGLAALFIASGVGARRSFTAILPIVVLALLAGLGTFVTYGVRLQVLLGEFGKEEAFQWSAVSSWAVLAAAPVLWLAWVFLEPAVRGWVNGGHAWAPPEGIVSATYKVEVVVWWLSHLLSVRGLSRGRKKYLDGASDTRTSLPDGLPAGTPAATGATLAPAADAPR